MPMFTMEETAKHNKLMGRMEWPVEYFEVDSYSEMLREYEYVGRLEMYWHLAIEAPLHTYRSYPLDWLS